jgi:pectate lyase
MAQTVQGFGASTPGGSGKPVYRVKNLNDSGAGSLRDAVSQGNRYIVFDVGGEIKLSKDVWVNGAFLTIDGTSAPAPGITLKYGALLIHGSSGAHDIIVRGIRSRQSKGCDTCATTGAGIGLRRAAYNVVLDHVSVAYAQDQALSISNGVYNVTVQYSIFAESQGADGKNLPILIASAPKRISLHHNLLIKGYERLPQVKYSDSGGQASDIELDLRNNLIWDWGYAATQIWKGARANVIANYYYDPGASDGGKKRAIFLCHANSRSPNCQTSDPKLYARAYTSGNVSGHGAAISDYLNSLGTDRTPFSPPTVSTTDACTAAQQVLAKSGVRPLDAVDSKYIGMVAITSCTSSLSRLLE